MYINNSVRSFVHMFQVLLSTSRSSTSLQTQVVRNHCIAAHFPTWQSLIFSKLALTANKSCMLAAVRRWAVWRLPMLSPQRRGKIGQWTTPLLPARTSTSARPHACRSLLTRRIGASQQPAHAWLTGASCTSLRRQRLQQSTQQSQQLAPAAGPSAKKGKKGR